MFIFFDLKPNDFKKLSKFKPDVLDKNLIYKFLKFYLWKRFKKILPKAFVKYLIYKFN